MSLAASLAGERGMRERVLVLVRGQRDGELTTQLLGRAEIDCAVCSDVDDLCQKIREGAAAALLTEEMLTAPAVRQLGRLLQTQQPWSDFPLVIFSTGARARDYAPDLEALGNVTFLDRPVSPRAMVMSARAAIRSRRRQYEGRAAIEARDTFLAMLGHELRNPLGAIRLAIEVQGAKLSRETRATIAKEQDVIDRQTRHLARLVDDLLDVARITHGKIALSIERLDLLEVARHVFDALEGSARAHGLTTELSLATREVLVRGDRDRLEQVVANLFTNAIKYTPRGGHVRISVWAEREEAVVAVADNGVGIMPDMLERVFEVFTQVERSIDRTQGGMGLGLSVVRSLVQLHRGRVDVVSEGAGRGSVFTVRLPLDRGAFDSVPPPGSQASANDAV